MKRFNYSKHASRRVLGRGLTHGQINYYRKNNLLVKCFDDGEESHYLGYIFEKQDYYLFVINDKINELVTCMQLKFAKRADAYSDDFKIEAYNLSMGNS